MPLVIITPYTTTTTTPQTYWRLLVQSSNGATFPQIAEIEMRSTIGGTDQCTGGVATSSGYSFAGAPQGAFNNDGANSFWWANSVSAWIRYQFPTPVSVVEVVVQGTGNPYLSGTITLQHSTNGTTWVATKAWSGANFTAGESRILAV